MIYRVLRHGNVRVIVLFAGLLLAYSPAFAQCNIHFGGRITDADSKLPLAGAIVSLVETGQRGVSDSLGYFHIAGICPGRYEVVIEHIGCTGLREHLHFSKDLMHDYSLDHAIKELSEVTVVATSAQGLGSSQLKGVELNLSKGQSLAEVTQRLAGVTVLQTGSNLSKPVIHGLHSNRVIILNNGIRQEGQQWGGEHAPEIDPFVANRITVIKGAATLRYGSDAIGGIILVEPRLLSYAPGTRGEMSLGFFSANLQAYVSALAEGHSPRHPAFAWRVQATVKRGGNARTPDYWLANSGTEEFNFSLHGGWRYKKGGFDVFYSQFNTRLGIFLGSHIGNTADLINVINSGKPPDYITDASFSYQIDRPFQKVQHHLLKWKGFLQTGDYSRLNIVTSYQFNHRREYDLKRFSSSSNEPQLELLLHTLGADVTWDHFKGSKWRGTLGINTGYQNNQYVQRFFIPNYQHWMLGAFVTERYHAGRWTLDGGLRVDTRSYFGINRNNGAAFNDRSFGNASGNFGVAYLLGSGIEASLSLSAAWRPPQINELYSEGLHHGAARLEKGNADLVAEKARGLIFSADVNRTRWQANVTLGHKRVSDFIYLEPVYPPQLTIRGAFPSFEFNQANARINSLDLQASVQLNRHFTWMPKASLVRAFDLEANDWIIQMPADRFENGLQYRLADGKTFRENFVKLAVLYVARQTRVPGTGNIEIVKPDGSIELASDYAPPHSDYTLLGLEMSTTWHTKGRPVNFVFTGANLLNKKYRDYMNAFRYYADEVGMNLALKVQLPLGKTD